MSEYLKWTVVLFILRVVVKTIIQALVLKKGFVKCKLTSIDPEERGYEWEKTARQGNIVLTLQVITLIVAVMQFYQCLYA
jgi:hypothetical protein